VPSNLTDLLERSKKHLNEEQSQQLSHLLTTYQDTFSKDDIDIDKFTKIEHCIDTGTSLPTKEGLRRTPLGFEKEEEKHLQDLLDKKMIQPSSSEWAAAPVICRKKHGGNLDRCKFNLEIRKDRWLQLANDCLHKIASLLQLDFPQSLVDLINKTMDPHHFRQLQFNTNEMELCKEYSSYNALPVTYFSIFSTSSTFVIGEYY
jgi:hypothetical protein